MDFLTSGGTFKLVFERILEAEDPTSAELKSALDIAGKFSTFADQTEIEKMNER